MSFYAPHIMCRKLEHYFDLVGKPDIEWAPSISKLKPMRFVKKPKKLTPTPTPKSPNEAKVCCMYIICVVLLSAGLITSNQSNDCVWSLDTWL